MKHTEEKTKGGRKRTHLVKVHLSDNEYEKLCKLDIYFTAVGLIDIPDENEIREMIEEIQKSA